MGARKNNTNAEGHGRPTSYRAAYNKQAYQLCLLGATDKELATFFEVTEQTINNWKGEHNSFFESVKRGKTVADAEVAVALHKRAIGYAYTEVTFEKVDNKATMEATADKVILQDAYKKKIVTKHLPADPGAAMNWLKNRQPTRWRDGFDVTVNQGSKLKAWTAEDVDAFEAWQSTQDEEVSHD